MNNLKILRQGQKMKQKELAAMLGIAQGTLSYWENGKYEIDNENLKKLADIFHVSIDYLLGYSDTPGSIYVPEELQGVTVAFHRGEFEDLTQDEIDTLAAIAKTLKEQRKKR